MENFSDIMILTNYSQNWKKIRQIIAVILVNLEEDFYSEKARKIGKMLKKLANYFLEQQGWTHFLEKTYFFLKKIINTVWSINDVQPDSMMKAFCLEFLPKQKCSGFLGVHH